MLSTAARRIVAAASKRTPAVAVNARAFGSAALHHHAEPTDYDKPIQVNTFPSRRFSLLQGGVVFLSGVFVMLALHDTAAMVNDIRSEHQFEKEVKGRKIVGEPVQVGKL